VHHRIHHFTGIATNLDSAYSNSKQIFFFCFTFVRIAVEEISPTEQPGDGRSENLTGKKISILMKSPYMAQMNIFASIFNRKKMLSNNDTKELLFAALPNESLIMPKRIGAFCSCQSKGTKYQFLRT